MIPQLNSYEPSQLKELHRLIFKKITTNNHIKTNLKKFQGFSSDEIKDREDFTIKNFSEDAIIDICGILEVPATPVFGDNVRKIIQRLSSETHVVDDNYDARSHVSYISGVSRRSQGPEEKVEIRTLIRQQSDIIFNLEQEIFEAEDLMDNENSVENVKSLERLKRKLSIHEKRKDDLDSQYKMLQQENARTPSSHHSESVREWVNNQPANVPVIDSLKNEVKSVRSMICKESQLSDFDGNSCIDWRYFKTRYDVSTKNLNLSNEENIIRLNKHLKGQARKKVELILKSCQNPDIVMKILNKEYGGDDKILKEILKKVENLKKINSLEEFKEFNISAQNISSVMSQLEDQTLFDAQKVMATLINRIPDHLITQWANFLLSNGLTLKQANMKLFTRWLDEMSEIVSEVSFHSIIYNFGKHIHQPQTESCSLDLEKTKQTNKTLTYNKLCKLCKSEYHPLFKCQDFLSIEPKKRYSTAKKLHFCICCLKQHHGSCKNKEVCKINNCGRTHHSLLHFDHINQDNTNEIEDVRACNSSSNVLLKIISVRIRNGSSEKSTVAFLDEGATISLIDENLANELNIQGSAEPISFEGYGNEVFEDLSSRNTRFEIAGENTNFYDISDVNTVTCLKLPRQSVNMKQILEKYPQLKNCNLSNQYSSEPQILLGQKHAALIISRNTIEIKNGPICSKTRLGWALHGPVAPGFSNFACCLQERSSVERNLDDLIRSQFIIENHGVNTSNQEDSSEEDKMCLDILENSISKVDGHFEVRLPWKNQNISFPNTYPLAMKRLNILEQKFLRNPDFKTAYTSQIEKLFEKGYARKIKFKDIKNRENVWVLPHFAVTNPKKPNKPPRVVFDAATKVEGKSLNDFLHTGPDWLTSIIGILIRFRQLKVAFAGDIREMFNQVKIKDEDAFAQCFLWKDNSTKKTELYQMKAMLFGIKSAPFIAQFVKNHNADEQEEQFPEAARAIKRNHYVDDYLDSMETVEEAISIIKDVIHVHAQGGFEIRSFVSNNVEVLECIPKHLLAENFNVSIESTHNYQKILGMKWNAKRDQLEFSSFLKEINEDILNLKKIPTKRDVLKITMSIFDPLGLLCPITIKARLLMQTISNSSIAWDTKINSDMFKAWKKWLLEIRDHENIVIPRCYLVSPVSKIQRIELHVFSDASGQAYCSAAYFRFVFESTVEVSLVYAKSRVNPKSFKTGKLSIPKMELMAAVLGTQISSIVRTETDFKIDQVYYWTDSSTVMVWLQERRKLPVFETNRVKKILENSNLNDWKWLSTKVNIADLGTRDNSVILSSKSEWFSGPKFLYQTETEWEKYTGKYNKALNNVEVVMAVDYKQNLASGLPSISKYSSYQKLTNVTAWIGRFLSNLKLKLLGKDMKLYPHIIPGDSDSEWALLKWAKLLQQESYPNDIVFVEKGINQQRRLIQHPVIMKDEVMRIDGRLSNCKFLSDKTKNPIILDGDHKFTKLLVQKMHEDVGHINTETLIVNFRLKFWMPKMKLKIKSIISKCLYCKHKSLQTVHTKIGNLPDCRFNVYAKPFKSCGIDYFGPYKVKIGRRLEDRYGVLFTCMTSRAIHVELANTLNTNSCILAIRRMKSRRGSIEELLSDNASNFKRANIELLEAISEIHPDLLRAELQRIGISWKNIPPRSPSFGGAWERLIGSFKRAIDSIFVTNRHPNEELLHTVFCEAEYLINSRPLYSTSNNPLDSLPLTPNDILLPGEHMESIQGNFSQDEISKKTWRTQQFLVECFWKRFIKEVIPTMLTKKQDIELSPNLKIGDLVYLKNEEVRKGKWPLGIISKVYPGNDSIVRVVDVKVGDKIYKRAANQLAFCDLN